jgi:hypothetical protein
MVPRVTGRARAALLAAAVVAYLGAAWMVAPGFYDGFAPPKPYAWVSPPPQLRAGNQQPQPGHATVKVGTNGVVDPGAVFTQDGQAAISFVPGAFVTPPDHSPVSIDIKPVADFPDPAGMHLSTNVYCFTTSSPLAQGRDALITLTYTDQLPAPSDVYGYQGDRPWQKLGSTGSAAPFSIAVRTTFIGCFAAGYPSNAAQTAQGTRVGGGQALPIVVALAILVVVLAGIPLAVMRRRSSGEEDEETEDRSS